MQSTTLGIMFIAIGVIQALGSAPFVYWQYARRHRRVAGRVVWLGLASSGVYSFLLGIAFTQLGASLAHGLLWFALALASALVGVLLLLAIGVWQLVMAALRLRTLEAHERQ